MSALNEFGETAARLARNPLGIIALFIFLIYAIASLIVGLGIHLQPEDDTHLIWFLVLFPFVVLAAFCWLVSQHHEKLYAPKDYNSDEGFLKSLEDRKQRKKHKDELLKIETDLQSRVREKLTSPEVIKALKGGSVRLQSQLVKAANQISDDLRRSITVTIDAKRFTDDNKARYEYPISLFSSFGELTDEVYSTLIGKVKPYEYGFTWVLKDKNTNAIIKNARMITGAKRGTPVNDKRTLTEVGITGGTVLEVVEP